MNWTEQEYQDFLSRTGKGKAAKPPAKRKNKYNAQQTWTDGICFDSRKEAEYYARLKLLHRAGAIAGFLHHGCMVVAEGTGIEARAALYETDFVILHADGSYEIVDTKGIETDAFKLKIKALKSRYPGVKIRTE